MNHGPPQKSEAIFKLLDQVKDPEIPVLSIVELEIIREVLPKADKILVRMTPTYSGCPAIEVMQAEVRECLEKAGFKTVEIELIYSPAWSSQWLGEEARSKLKQYGIAPPNTQSTLVGIGASKVTLCPYCDSKKTEIRSEYGSTSCKALHYCLDCQEPFEEFKSI